MLDVIKHMKKLIDEECCIDFAGVLHNSIWWAAYKWHQQILLYGNHPIGNGYNIWCLQSVAEFEIEKRQEQTPMVLGPLRFPHEQNSWDVFTICMRHACFKPWTSGSPFLGTDGGEAMFNGYQKVLLEMCGLVCMKYLHDWDQRKLTSMGGKGYSFIYLLFFFIICHWIRVRWWMSYQYAALQIRKLSGDFTNKASNIRAGNYRSQAVICSWICIT